jgi:pimeloyl-ACP methyl ester carboxylesterase
VFSFIAKPLDRYIIHSAAARFQPRPGVPNRAAEAEALLAEPDFFSNSVKAPPEVWFRSARKFQFRSPVSTPWNENNTVHGKFYRAGDNWPQKPSVVLLHGWSGEKGYYYQFPSIAWRLRFSGVNTLMIELPYHGQRKPTAHGAWRNFIAPDLFHMIQATQQAIGDIRSAVAWLAAQGSPTIGLWGFSMGAWLAGLVAAHDPRVGFSVLTSPLVDLQDAIQDLAFCEPIRQALGGEQLGWEHLNLTKCPPLAAPEQNLLVECLHDQFVRPSSVEAVWEAWKHPHIWRLRHGHISVLLSWPVMERTVEWVAQQAGA